MAWNPIRWGVERVGGAERAKVLALLAAMLGLDGADKGAIGAMAAPLEHAFRISRTDVGLLLTLTLAVGAVASLPFGWLVDRVNRTRLVAWTVVPWGVAMIAGGCATSYLFLLLTRLFLAGVSACVTPATASLLGDYFPVEERAQVYGYVMAGEFVGTGIGFLVAGELAVWTWRAGLIALGIPAFFLSWALVRLKEPARGGADRLEPAHPKKKGEARKVHVLAREKGIAPREKLLVDEPPRTRSIAWAALYVLRIPTSLVLILASALGYFFLSGLRAFGVQYLHGWFGVGHGTAVALGLLLGIAALLGVLISGRIADHLIQRGHLRGRVVVGVLAYLSTCALMLFGLWSGALWIGMALLLGAAFFLGAINPPLDAARLDIMHPGLWGRSEGIRTLLRKAGEALGPLAVGFVADHFYGTGVGGLHDALLLMVVPLVLGWLIGLVALWTYPRDVATAEENARRALSVKEATPRE